MAVNFFSQLLSQKLFFKKVFVTKVFSLLFFSDLKSVKEVYELNIPL